MRTQEEIAARIKSKQDSDIFGWETNDLLECLDTDHFRPFAKADADLSEWTPESSEVADVRSRLIDYMPFAWEKANDCRGLSANRSVMHMQAWLWLMGEGELLDRVENQIEYRQYGKPILTAICEHLGVDWRQWDNDRWTDYEDDDGVSADNALAGSTTGISNPPNHRER